jgi:hypothetical protein
MAGGAMAMKMAAKWLGRSALRTEKQAMSF